VPTASAELVAAPRPRRASAATPSAVACGDTYTSTGAWSRSACVCMRTRERVSPPSTRSRASGFPRSSPAARASQATCAAIPSITARTSSARVVASESPVKAPRAFGSQKGAARPARPGTKVAPPVPAACPPMASRSAASVMTPTSVSQRSAAPTVYTWPSRQ
jgi:hypothetical protein